MKEGIFIKPIRRHEADYLRKAGYAEYVNNGHGTYSKYFVVESQHVLNVLEKYRKSIRVK